MRPRACSAYRVHPRSRGENCRRQSRRPVEAGLIPAHAGKTARRRRTLRSRRAHPRSRGENAIDAIKSAFSGGSSPLTRGKHEVVPVVRLDRRLIPTHAGKTHQATCPTLDTRAHPRSCGENVSSIFRLTPPTGSSPLTRGKPDGRLSQNYQAGLIPAHTGKTLTQPRRLSCERAHPHSRGENQREPNEADPVLGSSPLTRGKPKTSLTGPITPGLIPTHAGKTRAR